ncbi:MAG: DUF4369 domain-containing protein, partial [Bacteroidales bacterium]|nr:DUF4369 domain-containing protein [Bacteroidales bacterium]
MKKISFLIIAAVLLLASCTPKNQVVINGDVFGLEDGKVYLAVRENKIWVMLDSCVTDNGKFQLKATIDEPRLAFLMNGQNRNSRIPILIEAGTITVIGSVSDDNVVIKGSNLNDEYQSIMTQVDDLDKEYYRLAAAYADAQQSGINAQESGDLMGMANSVIQMAEAK